jgi:hypothetical protein
MFKANCTTSFKTDKLKSEVFKIIEDNLETLGSVDVTENGTVRINAEKNNSFSHNCQIQGKVKERDGKYSIDLDIEVKPSLLIWALIIVGGLGLILFALPLLAKSDLQKKADRALENIRTDFK